MNISDYILTNRSRTSMVSKAITCADGLRLSVQANKFFYCHPRDDFGPYTAVEVGFPTARVEELMPYAESPETPTHSVYGYVPVEVVEKIIADHGGAVSEGADR